MTEPAIPDWVRMNVGAAARDALMLIEQELEGEQSKTNHLAYAMLDKGTLTPDRALAFWHEKHALYVLHRRLTQKARQGVSSAQRIGETNGG